LAKHFFDFLERPTRSRKPRMKGITMVFDPISPLALSRYAEYIDIVKFLDSTLWAPDDVMKETINLYKKYNLDMQMGGIPYEIARLEGKEERFLEEAKELGINIVEYETHIAKPTKEQMQAEVDVLKKKGFMVVGEVGSKWWWKDPTRLSRDRINIVNTIDEFSSYLDAGCDKMYWEGLIVVNLIGKYLDNKEGQKALLEVTNTIGPEKIVFEVWGPGLTTLEPARIISWLVYHFGPDVNLANIFGEPIGIIESVRKGTLYEMDHPYMRWLKGGKSTKDWWSIEAPQYDIYVERMPVMSESK